jgi:hypothetical protein
VVRQACDQCVNPIVIKAKAINQPTITLETKNPWLRVTRLRSWSDSAHFNVSKAKTRKSGDSDGVFIKPCSQADRIGKS